MPTSFCPGYDKTPFSALVENYPDNSVYPSNAFRTEWGPIFHRGRLDGSSRLLIIGQDPAQHETVVRRILVGTAGKRAQGLVNRLGVTTSYTFINTFLYSVFGSKGAAHVQDAGIAAYRNSWIKAILDTNPIDAVIAFGGLAQTAWAQWLASPQAAGRPAMAFQHLTHPTWPESSSKSKADHDAAIKSLLANWNAGMQAIRPSLTHPDVVIPLSLYGSSFASADLPDIPMGDMPPGLPLWMSTEERWADRQKGGTAEQKRRTIVTTVPNSVVL
jgi:hypothetical protein